MKKKKKIFCLRYFISSIAKWFEFSNNSNREREIQHCILNFEEFSIKFSIIKIAYLMARLLHWWCSHFTWTMWFVLCMVDDVPVLIWIAIFYGSGLIVFRVICEKTWCIGLTPSNESKYLHYPFVNSMNWCLSETSLMALCWVLCWFHFTSPFGYRNHERKG